ncbi:unnamed protein product [Aureobasidium pullulans]|nr:unnamed protein product [Aureobasidium pullulans]
MIPCRCRSKPIHHLCPWIKRGEEFWEVENIVASEHRRRGKGNQLFYLVKYLGFDQPQWEPWQNLVDGSEHVVAEFHADARSKGQPGPWRGFKLPLDSDEPSDATAAMTKLVSEEPAPQTADPVKNQASCAPLPKSSDGFRPVPMYADNHARSLNSLRHRRLCVRSDTSRRPR